MAFLFTFINVLVMLLLHWTSAEAHKRQCRPVVGSKHWPLEKEWNALNDSVSGLLLRPVPPAAVCHYNRPEFNNASCAYVTAQWTNASFHASDPISIDSPNFSNDSCLPDPAAPCTGEGYPVYVINASSPEHVQAGVNFAREKKIRLIVKASGHDYLGRSIAPNSLSIWTRYLQGMQFNDAFSAGNCSSSPNLSAVRIQTGTPMKDIYAQTDIRNLTIVGGTADDISLGGYVTGGGHSPLSASYGLAVDQVLELEIVTPSGKILTANECKNTDIFWAVRGGGGSTFGVVLSFTVKTFPIMPISTYNIQIITLGNLDAYWNSTAYILSQYPSLSEGGLAGYTYVIPAYSGPGSNGSTIMAFGGTFLTLNVSSGARSAFLPVEQHINATWPDQVIVKGDEFEFPTLYEWYLVNKNVFPVGDDSVVGNRLLNGTVLSKPLPEIRKALEGSIAPGSLANINLIAGRGVRDAKPAGGSNAMHPAWRSAIAEYAIPSKWTALNTTQKLEAEHDLTYKYVQALREFAPGAGSYLNEGDINEPDYQQTFWGSNYARLLRIKRKVDPHDVFWCHPCVGDERWQEFGDSVCRV